MASNPMQRQKKVSFLLGFLTMLVIAAIAIVILGKFALDKQDEINKLKSTRVNAYALEEDVNAGDEITQDKLLKQEVDQGIIPSNFITDNNMPEGDWVAKINLKAGTVITEDMINKIGVPITNDIREQEYNIASIPSTMTTGDYIDVRIRFPSGVDYIVLSKKKIEFPTIAGSEDAEQFILKLSEEEILSMSSAIVENYINKGSEIYLDKYIEPGIQEASTITYPINTKVMELIQKNPNILQEAKNALNTIYNAAYNGSTYYATERSRVEEEMGEYSTEAEGNVESGIKEHITKQKEFRQKYLEELAGGDVQ